MQGKPCVRGMRITAGLMVNLVANGMTTEEIVREYPEIQSEDVRQCLLYAAALVEGRDVELTAPPAPTRGTSDSRRPGGGT